MWNEIIVGKQREFAQLIVRYVEDEMDEGQIPQPIFIVGSRGSGKSTIIGLLDPMLEKDVKAGRPYVLDGKRFFCSEDIIRAMEEMDFHEEVSLMEKYNECRKIVMIDDLDYYFKRASFEDQYILRSYLNRESAPLLIATISGIGNFLADYRAPFFEGIRIMYVPKIDESMVDGISMSKKGVGRLAALMKLLSPVVRSLKIAFEIVSLSDDQNADIANLLERVGGEYRMTFENLPVNSQKILVAFAGSESPMTLSELRGSTGLQSGILSSYLRQLLKLGMIRKIHPDKHGTPYEICDKLFKLWIITDA